MSCIESRKPIRWWKKKSLNKNFGNLTEGHDYQSGENYLVWIGDDGKLEFGQFKNERRLKNFLKTIPDTWDFYDNRADAVSEFKRRKVVMDKNDDKYPKFRK